MDQNGPRYLMKKRLILPQEAKKNVFKIQRIEKMIIFVAE